MTTQNYHKKNVRKMDGASRFKYESLRAIKRRKLLTVWGFRILCALAVLSVLALIAVYVID